MATTNVELMHECFPNTHTWENKNEIRQRIISRRKEERCECGKKQSSTKEKVLMTYHYEIKVQYIK